VIRAAADAARSQEQGAKAYGFPKLAEVFGEIVAKTVADWLDFRRPEPWPEPEPFGEIPPVMPFDPEFLPDAIAPWVMDIAERMQCPPDFVAVSAMVALGSALGRKVAVRPQRFTDWYEVPNLWGLNVGRECPAGLRQEC
jgi:Protein of unknown function (DUF3987)